jgi:hypothetical protein
MGFLIRLVVNAVALICVASSNRGLEPSRR